MTDRKAKRLTRARSRKGGACDPLEAALAKLDAIGQNMDDGPRESDQGSTYRAGPRPLAAELAAEAATNAIATMLASDGLIVDPTHPPPGLGPDGGRPGIHPTRPPEVKLNDAVRKFIAQQRFASQCHAAHLYRAPAPWTKHPTPGLPPASHPPRGN
jgi:hypothetical protein